MNQEELETARQLIKTQLKIRAYVACGWGLIVLFAMMGVVLGKQAGMYVGVIGAVMWVLNRIIREAFDALSLLRGLKVEKDGNPPESPT